MSKPLHITEVVLRDAHQSLLATRMRVEDMLPIAAELDDIGYWSLETWGGATFDACIRYLGEDPWQRLRLLKQAMPKTPMQMLLRGQNLLGYRHYADDVVSKFVERAHQSGMDVFRIFDAMNDIRNFRTAVGAAINVGAHAQGTLSYTTSPVHNQQSWVDLAKQLEDLGCHSLCIKDMSGLLKPYEAESLVSAIKQSCDIPLALHCHATTGLSIATALKAVEAGVDILDTAISSMSCTYGHTPTETVVAMLEDTEQETRLKLDKLESVARYFRVVRKKYAQWEGQLKGVDSRILIAQVPGGMLTNMESQLKEQGAQDRLDEVLEEIPKVREDLGFIPLVTPTSQIVGTQAVLNVLAGDRYKTLTKETIGLLKGEYGAAPAPVNSDLQQRVLAGEAAITCRPADRIPDELTALTSELNQLAEEQNIELADSPVDDVLTYALFPQIGLKFLKNRGDVSAFEALPEDTNTESTENAPSHTQHPENEMESDRMVQRYSVRVDGQLFSVEVGPEGELTEIKGQPQQTQPIDPQTNSQSASLEVSSQFNSLQEVVAPLAGTIFTIKANEGELVAEGDVLVVLEAMKMETEVRAAHAGVVRQVLIKEGDVVSLGMSLMQIES